MRKTQNHIVSLTHDYPPSSWWRLNVWNIWFYDLQLIQKGSHLIHQAVTLEERRKEEMLFEGEYIKLMATNLWQPILGNQRSVPIARTLFSKYQLWLYNFPLCPAVIFTVSLFLPNSEFQEMHGIGHSVKILQGTFKQISLRETFNFKRAKFMSKFPKCVYLTAMTW